MKILKHKSFSGCLLLLVILAVRPSRAAAADETLASGAFIVNMGVTPQTVGNGLKPYGMIYDLVKNYKVPVKWVINTTKAKDGLDFNYSGVDYKGGPFIIEADRRSATVNARIAYWQSQGVVGVTTTAAITVPVYATILVMPRWTLDQQNGSIAAGFFTNAGIPTSSYNNKLPSTLTCCDDLFVMPHADPKWTTHGNLFAWNLNCDGGIWLGCHAGSALEDMFNTASPTQQTNFLAEKTGTATGGGPYSQNALLLWGNHTAGTLPYSYDYPTDPIMQFMGIIDGATQNGSEQIYIPLSPGWRPTTKVGVYDPDHSQRVSGASQHRAAILAWGKGLGDANRGYVMLEASHTINGATATANIAAQRAFYNFSMLTAIERAVIPQPTTPSSTLYSGVGATFSYTLPSGYFQADYTPLWTSSCGGTFSPNANSHTVTFTPPTVGSATDCFITVEISDACGRKFSNSQKITILCSLTASASVSHPTCAGAANGSVSLSVSGGSTPYSYNWSRVSPAGTGSGTGTTISGLTAGTYNITVTSSGGCAASLSATLTSSSALTASNSAVNVLCNGASTGSINLTASGGTTPYTYNWGSGVTSEDRSSLSIGTYTVTVTDSKGCTATSSATLTQPTALVVSLSSTPVACFGQSTGAITTTPSGGTSPYTYNWGGGVTTQNRSGLAAGTYTVTVTDANSCTKTASIAVTQPAAAVSLTAAVTNISCGMGAGALNLTAAGGTAPYIYDWADVAGASNPEDRTGLALGTYTVTVTDANGCTGTTSASVITTSGASLSTSVTNVACFGGSTGAINLTATGNSPFTFSWAGGATTEDRTSLAAGTYSVTVTDANGCSSTTSATVTQPAAALAASGTTINPACNGNSTGSIDLTPTGGTSPYTYNWGGGVTSQDRSTLAAGTFTVTVTDANSCTKVVAFTLTQPAALSLSTVITHETCPGTADGAIDLSVTGGTPAYTYDWTDLVGTSNPQDRTGLTAGTYIVMVTDSNGCTATTSATLTTLNPLPTPPSGVNH